MGFYPFMRAKMERATVDGKRVIVASVFDSVMDRWIDQSFPGYDEFEAPMLWIIKHMKQLEM